MTKINFVCYEINESYIFININMQTFSAVKDELL